MVADMFIFGLPIVIQIIFFIVFSVKKNKQLRKHPMLLNALSSVAASFLLIASVFVVMKTYDYKLECDLKTFDKDGDGIYSCGGFNTCRFSATLCVVTKGIKADCNHLKRTYNAKH